jgi:hypothetical protein
VIFDILFCSKVSFPIYKSIDTSYLLQLKFVISFTGHSYQSIMSQSIPKTQKAWTIQGKTGFDCLKFNKGVPVHEPGDYECLVKLHAASLNYRDLVIPQGKYPFPQKDAGFVPGSDGSGEVVSVGRKVTRFKAGDKVCFQF